ncbi:hypothetical protein [uncultured Flavobacterium sp.]|uniref:hypothetical protein n=1 Tax=uncultured Flavobacterium sp. TaxID=165435 RepID=UPI0025E6826E|nr:hypothetical protein [uncultured Flavobacterium sp.]
MEVSNKHKGTNFEDIAKEIICNLKGISLIKDIKVDVGISNRKKGHKFDFANLEEKVLVECKFHEWTITGNSPSAKMSTWNEAMLYFMLAPKDFTNILFVKSSSHIKRKETLAEYYHRTYSHFIPENVEIWEYNIETELLRIHK